MNNNKSPSSLLKHFYTSALNVNFSDTDESVFFAYVYDYMDIIKKQLLLSPSLHTFWHEKAGEWYPVLKKIKNDPSLSEEERKRKIDMQSEFYFLASFNVLQVVHDTVEKYKETGDEKILDSMSLWIPRIQRSLQKVHPVIMSVLETDVGEKTEENTIPILVISATKGIYQKDVPDHVYPLKRNTKRHKLVRLLLAHDTLGLSDLEKTLEQNRMLVQKEIREINTTFREKVQVPYDLIIHHDTGGFSLNKNAFVIRKEV